MRRILFLLIISLFYPNFVRADSIFLAPTNLPLYQKEKSSLNASEVWKLKIFGLRMAALDPKIWGLLQQDRTENRRLVPIKPYFLRASEEADFRFKNIFFKFKFKETSVSSMLKNAHFKESVFDLGVAGEFDKSKKIDRGYVIRFSAYPPIDSGLYYRSKSKFVLLQKFSNLQILPNIEYSVILSAQSSGFSLLIDNIQQLNSKSIDIEKGLFSLTTGWNPVSFKELNIHALKNRQEDTIYSGLHEYK